MTRVYEEILGFIAGGSTPDDVAVWTPSQDARDRVAERVRGEKEDTLSPDERAELNHYMELGHLMRLTKAWVRRGRRDE